MSLFNTWEEAEEAFYKVNDCVSDDSDSEGARLERWVEGCEHKIGEDYTLEEWNELKKEANRLAI